MLFRSQVFCDVLFEHLYSSAELYIAKNLECSDDLDCLIKKFEQPVVEKPIRPPVPADPTDLDYLDDVDFYNLEKKTYMARKTKVKANLKTIFAVIWGQCSE